MSKIADRPHVISIGLSIVAVIVSVLSWTESRRSRYINEGSSRAIAYITNLTPRVENNRLYGVLKTKNFGRSSATYVNCVASIRTRDLPPKDEDYGGAPMFDWQGLPPGFEKETPMLIDENLDSLNNNQYVYGILSYVDEASGQSFQQKWCFRIVNKSNPVAISCN